MKHEELKTILDDHALWLRGEGGNCANLGGADLRCAELRGADLRCAELRGANLRGADLRCANLRGADLRCAELRGADLRCAELRGANLRWADLTWADLRLADLSEANLSEANLSGAQVAVAICRVDFGGWSICVYADRTSIGCQTHPNDSWLAWMPDSPEIGRMHPNASDWWATHGEAIKAVIRCVMAKATKGGEA